MNNQFSINNISKEEKFLSIEWSDGKISNFHFMWLRDNCPYGVHPTARQRVFNIVTVSKNIHPESYSLNNKGKLEIKWSEGNHISYYDPNWLRKNCYTLKKKYVSPYRLWDKKLNNG